MELELCCDKCGRPVSHNNNAVCLELVVMRMRKYGADYKPEECDGWDYTVILSHGARHLLPINENNEVVCAGSPSRAQYIAGQPPDARGFGYIAERETEVRNAYARLQSGSKI